MGFEDKDKGNSRHDQACMFLAQPEQVRNIVRAVVKYDDEPNAIANRCIREERLSSQVDKWVAETTKSDGTLAVKLEVPLFTRSRFAVGFIDVSVNYTVNEEVDVLIFKEYVERLRNQGYHMSRYTLDPVFDRYRINCTKRRAGSVDIEVKITKQNIGDTLRQMKLYQETKYPGGNSTGYWALVTDYDITQEEQDALQREGIFHARLGPKFDAYIAEQEKRISTPQLSL